MADYCFGFNGFAKVCEQQGLTLTDQIAAHLAKPAEEQDIAELARLLRQTTEWNDQR